MRESLMSTLCASQGGLHPKGLATLAHQAWHSSRAQSQQGASSCHLVSLSPRHLQNERRAWSLLPHMLASERLHILHQLQPTRACSSASEG